MSMKNVLWVLIFSLLLLYGVINHLQGEKTLALQEGRSPSIGVLDMEVVRKAHPLYDHPRRMHEELHYFYRQLEEEEKSLLLVEQELQKQQDDLDRKKDAALHKVKEEYEALIAQKEEAINKRLEELKEESYATFYQELEREEARLNQEAQGRISSHYGKGEEEFQRAVEELLDEYKPLILNLRLKVLVLNLLPMEKEALQEEILSLEEELKRKIQIKREDLERGLQEYSSFIQRQVMVELQDFHRRSKRELEDYLRLQGRRLTHELEDFIHKTNRQLQLALAKEREALILEEEKKMDLMERSIQGEIKGRIIFLKEEIHRLEGVKASIHQEMEGEIREVVAIIAQDKGLDLVLQGHLLMITGPDITSLVVNKLQ